MLETLRRDGVSVHEGFVSCDLLDGLREEFERILKMPDDGIVHIEHQPGRAFRIALDDPGLRTGKLQNSSLASVFFNETLEKLASAYLPGSDFCNAVIGTKEFQAMPLSDIHFDTHRSLKFMIYLDDTTAANGAFCYVKGSQRQNTSYRKRFAQLGGVPELIPNALPEEHRAHATSIEAVAGTLIVFDTDGFHAGGVLQPGTTRRVLRAQCKASASGSWKVMKLLPYRIRYSDFNPAMLFSRIAAPSYRATKGTSRAQPVD
ncbi:phytanoyl-CoA dioxygenase family protein [Denitrobaculum tricleocarpae]|uniref:Phytanoyl-CoA dioxygenase family protein n=1 Tax=Denitrobaculum tricleocarpae TaxID=2591009 RepID=A0A545TUI6_9PROT|nr:phytanoyl-CoA dioxygenase family protein [Denitrobaculum tricleocarpae]TQV80831.1 phytanoyl-CoA dioxygenase family protein [Denitrobaculum tricleocarpae]